MRAGTLFDPDELKKIRRCFYYVERDHEGTERLFFDNAGGSLRLKAAEDAFSRIDRIPDASEHSNRVARYLESVEQKGRQDLIECIFGAKSGVLYPSYSASQIMMELCRVFSANAKGTNVVTTVLEHPSAYDAMQYYAGIYGREFRVAQADRKTGGVDADAVLSLIDRDTAILSCMYASNISGYIYDIETIFREAKKINPDLLILCDAVQHAPHAALSPESCGCDAMTFAPYKFFGIRGFGAAWISDRAASFMHHRLLGKSPDTWDIGSPAPAHYAAISAVVDYVISLGKKELPSESSERKLYEAGMRRIADHERALLDLALNGTDHTEGLRTIPGVKVQMDGPDLTRHDLIFSVEFDRLDCVRACEEYEKRGIVAFERSAQSLYSKRMLDAFGSKGVVRLSPLHVHSPEEIERFLLVTKEIAAL